MLLLAIVIWSERLFDAFTHQLLIFVQHFPLTLISLHVSTCSACVSVRGKERKREKEKERKSERIREAERARERVKKMEKERGTE